VPLPDRTVSRFITDSRKGSNAVLRDGERTTDEVAAGERPEAVGDA